MMFVYVNWKLMIEISLIYNSIGYWLGIVYGEVCGNKGW